MTIEAHFQQVIYNGTHLFGNDISLSDFGIQANSKSKIIVVSRNIIIFIKNMKKESFPTICIYILHYIEFHLETFLITELAVID